MRKALIGLIVTAAAVVPLASASAQTWGGRDDRHAEHQQERADRQAQRAERQEQRSARQEQRGQVRAERQQFNGGDRQIRQENANRGFDRGQAQVQQRGWQGQNFDRSQNFDRGERSATAERRNFDRGDRGQGGNWDRNRSGNWNGGNVQRDRRGDWDRNRGDWNRGGRDRSGGWNRGWRNDNRYDWQHYRNYNRGAFHGRPYYAPYRGYRYNRFSIGIFLDPLFYSSNYWIADPWYYRLPPAPPGAHWVRYYNDVLLVDTYSGEVIDVIYDFFW